SGAGVAESFIESDKEVMSGRPGSWRAAGDCLKSGVLNSLLCFGSAQAIMKGLFCSTSMFIRRFCRRFSFWRAEGGGILAYTARGSGPQAIIHKSGVYMMRHYEVVFVVHPGQSEQVPAM